ncbi:DUF2187 domain-containing protein [Bacillus pseudomycoides]|uniref:DUF2187 domain-containing protein n=1 Tax=Bacillus pseudomycoides TaxID=64104 RepID=UPI000BF6CFD2|nr:DUF2187 domain-containing protein [Bacillus pseudomycoides]PEP82113.1 DUF2187 domain-containing protein [Bacillus pseudomycoides]PGF07737.1 DUF2187 domain-containing protein [Bacillus pseudomycoides]
MEKIISVPTFKIGDHVEFPHRKNPSLKLTGYVANILTHTLIVEITDPLAFRSIPGLEARQVIRIEKCKIVGHSKFHAIKVVPTFMSFYNN